jgi:hypothetical protein
MKVRKRKIKKRVDSLLRSMPPHPEIGSYKRVDADAMATYVLILTLLYALSALI